MVALCKWELPHCGHCWGNSCPSKASLRGWKRFFHPQFGQDNCMAAGLIIFFLIKVLRHPCRLSGFHGGITAISDGTIALDHRRGKDGPIDILTVFNSGHFFTRTLMIRGIGMTFTLRPKHRASTTPDPGHIRRKHRPAFY